MRERLPIGVGMIQQWLGVYEPQPLFERLRETGAQFIELHLSAKYWEKRENWLSLALSCGLGFSFHGPYHNDYDITTFENKRENATRRLYIETFENAAKISGRVNDPVLINLHGAAGRGARKEMLLEKTVEFLKWLFGETRARGWPFYYVLELLPHTSHKTRAGDCISDLLRMNLEVSGELAGFCWDFGHFRINEITGYGSALEDEFLNRVRHVHIHDIKDKDVDFDHCPLKFGEVPYDHYLKLLAGKDISMVLELNYEHTAVCGDPYAELLASIRKLMVARDELIGKNELPG